MGEAAQENRQRDEQWLHDRIGGLCCRYMTLVAPLSGGVVEQAYRLRDDIMAVLASQSEGATDA